MERLQERIQSATKALKTLEELVKIKKPTTIERDAAIQRFEYSFEVCWKAGKQFLFDVEGIDLGSPKGVIRSLRTVGILSKKRQYWDYIWLIIVT